MKRIHMALVLTMVLAVAAFVPMASASPVGLGTLELNAGYAKSSSEVGTSTESMGGGMTFGAAYWRSMSPSVSWGAEVSYDNVGTADASYYDALTATTYHEEFSTKMLRFAPSIRMNFGAPVGPSFFAQGGVGLYNASWDYSYDDGVTVAKTDGSDSNIGFNVGAGVGFPVGPKTKLNFSGNYHIVPGVEENNVKLTDNTNYLQFRAGIGFGL